MKWFFPAKTFLLGEYIALQGGPAIVLTTTPCFEVSLTKNPGLQGIHPESPAGQWWLRQSIHTHGLSWYDPYQGKGGLGASGAQFLGAYMASQHLLFKEKDRQIEPATLLNQYLQVAGKSDGTPPSGYDVLAQCIQGCALIHRQQASYESSAWPFTNLAFILLRTGVKVATHEHLNQVNLKEKLTDLMSAAMMAYQAWKIADEAQLVSAVRVYHEKLKNRHWVAHHTLQQIETLDALLKPLAIKGCGAMGADVILLLVPTNDLTSFCEKLIAANWHILATSRNIYTQNTSKCDFSADTFLAKVSTKSSQ